jgi:hypothetical protein
MTKKKEKKSRPRKPAEQKRRRGSASVKIKGAGLLVSTLKKMEPLMRQRFVAAINGELAAIGMDLARGKDRTRIVEVRRGRDGSKLYEVKEVPRARAKGVRR